MEAERTMKRIRDWLLLRFLPAWAKESVYKENQRLRDKLEQQQHEIDRLNAYAAGLEYAVRRRMVIKNEVSK